MENKHRAKQIARAALSETAQCPRLDRLSEYAQGLLEDFEAAQVEAHIGACARCTAELALLAQFYQADREDSPDVRWVASQINKRAGEILPRPERAGEREPWWQAWFGLRAMRTWSLAAAGLLVVATGGLYLQSEREPALAPGLASQASIMRSAQVEAVAPAGDLAAPPTQLEWQPPAGAVRYRVRLMEVDRTELWQGESAASPIPLPAEARSLVVPGKTLLWEVVALNQRGETTASSAIQRFRLRVSRN